MEEESDVNIIITVISLYYWSEQPSCYKLDHLYIDLFQFLFSYFPLFIYIFIYLNIYLFIHSKYLWLNKQINLIYQIHIDMSAIFVVTFRRDMWLDRNSLDRNITVLNCLNFLMKRINGINHVRFHKISSL